MTNPEQDILMSMSLLRSNVPGKSKEFKHAIGTYYTKRKVWQIRAINYTIVIGVMALVGLTIYSIV